MEIGGCGITAAAST